MAWEANLKFVKVQGQIHQSGWNLIQGRLVKAQRRTRRGIVRVEVSWRGLTPKALDCDPLSPANTATFEDKLSLAKRPWIEGTDRQVGKRRQETFKRNPIRLKSVFATSNSTSFSGKGKDKSIVKCKSQAKTKSEGESKSQDFSPKQSARANGAWGQLQESGWSANTG